MEQILIVASITFLVMISPGPDMIIVTRNTLIGGFSGGLWTSLGVLTGNLVHMTYCLLGIGLLISQSIVAFNLLKYASAVYLIYLGISSLRAQKPPAQDTKPHSAKSNNQWFWQGFINNLLNPKGALFYLGVFTMVITPETSVSRILILILTMTLISTSFWLLFVLTLDRPFVRELLENSQRTVNRIFGALLIGLGIRIALIEK